MESLKIDKRKQGKLSVEKGKKFEETVADLYLLLGAELQKGITICNKKVDILAIFRVPGSTVEHRVLIECKDEKKAVDQNQRIMQFKGLLETARKSGEADSAEIITRVPWSDAAKGFARLSGINLATYTDKMTQLIDFTLYMKDIIYKFNEKDVARPNEVPLGKYYVDTSVKSSANDNEKPVLATKYLKEWLNNVSKCHLAILGEYGAGKSSLCLKLANDLASEYLNSSGTGRIPILLNLKEFSKTLSIEPFISNFLDQVCNVSNPRYKLFEKMNDAGMFILIFDGFDEMAVKVDSDILELNIQEIEKLSASPNSKVILTSRPEYFINAEEENTTFKPTVNVFTGRNADYDIIRLLPWDEKQVEAFLEKRVPLVKDINHTWQFYRDKIRGITKLRDLSHRPVLLDMIVKTLPALIEANVTINLPNLYNIYIQEELKRQKVGKRRTLLMDDKTRYKLLEQVAFDIQCESISELKYNDIMMRIEKEVNPQRHELEAYTRDFLTCSFLSRINDTYNFSHKSIFEYIISRIIVNEICNSTPNLVNRCFINKAVTEFIVAQDPDTGVLWNWINTKTVGEENQALFSNAVTILSRTDKDFFEGKDLSNRRLVKANLSSASLKGTNLRGSALCKVNLSGAKFSKEDVTGAEFIECKFSLKAIANNIVKYNELFTLFKDDFKCTGYANKGFNVIGISIMTIDVKEHFLLSVMLSAKDLAACEEASLQLSNEYEGVFALYNDVFDDLCSEAIGKSIDDKLVYNNDDE